MLAEGMIAAQVEHKLLVLLGTDHAARLLPVSTDMGERSCHTRAFHALEAEHGKGVRLLAVLTMNGDSFAGKLR